MIKSKFKTLYFRRNDGVIFSCLEESAMHEHVLRHRVYIPPRRRDRQHIDQETSMRRVKEGYMMTHSPWTFEPCDQNGDPLQS